MDLLREAKQRHFYQLKKQDTLFFGENKIMEKTYPAFLASFKRQGICVFLGVDFNNPH